MFRHTIITLYLTLCCIAGGFAQTDTTKEKDLTFKGTVIDPYAVDTDSSGKIKFSGYLDAYYARYSDTAGFNNFQKFPTTSPQSNVIGLNIIQFSAKYSADKFRGTGTVFFGDIPQSAWSPRYNMIQEANMGFQLFKNVWIDAGFFRTHIGLESIQPRENIAMSLATTTYFEPYFCSGAKLTWNANDKHTIQFHVLNSFNTFIETNKNKALGLSYAFHPNDKINLTFNTVVCDESPATQKRKQTRSYNNLVFVYSGNRLILGYEFNFGYQTNTKLNDTTAAATMWSSLLAVKYRFTPKFAGYIRGEIYQDPDEILSGPVETVNHQLAGLSIVGGTVGLEYKPIPNSYVRIEGRALESKSDEQIFYWQNQSHNIRYECLLGLGVWF